MTIYVDQPVRNQNDWFNVILPTGGVVTNNPYNVPTGITYQTVTGDNFDVGHTFVAFEKINTDGTSVTQTIGFYPSGNGINSRGTIKLSFVNFFISQSSPLCYYHLSLYGLCC